MHTPILILHSPNNGFVAGDGDGITAVGATPEQALAKLREETEQYYAKRRKEMIIEPLPPGEDPWQRMIGTWDPDDPVIEEWNKAVEEYRQQRDAELDSL